MAERIEGEPNLSRRGFVILAGMAAGGAACGPITRLIEEAIQTPTSAEPTKTRTLTPIPTNTATPTPTETPIPTPDFETIDSKNQAFLEQARASEIIDLPYPRITSFWIFPWFAKENEPKEAVIALVWGKNWSSAIVTSADCLYDFYKRTNGLDRQVVPFLKIFQTKDDAARVINLNAQNSQFPFPIIDAKGMDIVDPETEKFKFQECEEVKELERLQRFLASVDWGSLPNDIGEISGRELGEFVVSFLRGLEEAGIDVPFFP